MLRKTLSVLLTFSLWCGTSRLGLAQTSSTTNPSTATPQVNTKQERFGGKSEDAHSETRRRSGRANRAQAAGQDEGKRLRQLSR